MHKKTHIFFSTGKYKEIQHYYLELYYRFLRGVGGYGGIYSLSVLKYHSRNIITIDKSIYNVMFVLNTQHLNFQIKLF